ncbi:FAD:protein FMN transferase [Nitratiruptor sp. YY08-26]|nr:FAD:protein FMN transferase [Nitratiruptor sp. YY08-13]BCD65463.1 FAD:protein FMN transferase [Nitratiruptor sp. YY08-26]
MILYAPANVAQQVAQEIFSQTKKLEKRYNFFDPNSWLFAVNARKVQTVDEESYQILEQAKRFYEKTGGIFDVSTGALKECLQYKSLAQIEECIAKRKSFCGWEHIQLQKRKITFDNPYTKIDLGGFVKEYAVDSAKRVLKRHKVNGIINFGGDIFAVGTKPDGSAFRIGIKNPKDPSKFAIFVELQDMAIATSGNYERFVEKEGCKISHIVGAKEKVASVSVVAPTCLESGVYATALHIKSCLEQPYKTIFIYN